MIGLMGLVPPVKAVDSVTESKKYTDKESLAASSKRLLTNGDILAVTASTFIIHAVIGCIKPLSQVILDEEFGFSMVKRSFVISIATVSFFVTAPLAGWLSDKMSRPKLVSLSLVLMSESSRHMGFLCLRRTPRCINGYAKE